MFDETKKNGAHSDYFGTLLYLVVFAHLDHRALLIAFGKTVIATEQTERSIAAN